MRIDTILARKQTYSYEIFPPRGELPLQQAKEIAGELAQDHPDWISTTFSAGGHGNSQNVAAICAQTQNELGVTALAHLTCMGSTKEDVDYYLDTLEHDGIQNVLALRGDKTAGKEPKDFRYASDLIAYIKEHHPSLCCGAACYPEGHIETKNIKESMEVMKYKQDAGADFFVTQLFFDNEYFYRFRESCARSRIKRPIVVGIMPFTSQKQIQRIAFTCGASIPSAVIKRIIAAGDDRDKQAQAGLEYAIEQLQDLAQNGVDGLHIYTMNKLQVAHQIHSALKECGYLAA
ncbi:methylenetetrahydrofolate reductase [Atopobium sp. oral taxon 416]|uniref:methylenetetrahydrofolate reductase n=1 Tax=Atopobium sp. oral taxon 416 TaxID=712157 RepID=UPI001BA89B40|nr:methylenetetrahydrofolate reductase [Atopobium sp. oral taxon 416]QUC02401.1 methylenetetrahydrofolate reductase [Atopobium sp. oral taxon 416]